MKGGHLLTFMLSGISIYCLNLLGFRLTLLLNDKSQALGASIFRVWRDTVTCARLLERRQVGNSKVASVRWHLCSGA